MTMQVIKPQPCESKCYTESDVCHYTPTFTTLTRDLSKAGTCTHHFIFSMFPDLPKFIQSRELPKAGDPRSLAPKGLESLVGTAFDRRLRYEYDPDYRDNVVTDGALGLRYGHNVNLKSELLNEDLEIRSLYAAVADHQYRSDAGWASYSKLQEPDILNLCKEDLRNLMDIARENLKLTDPVFGPTFPDTPLKADADLISENTLIDIKTVASKPSPPAWFRQCIGYVLLDTQDIYKLKSIGIYLSRHGLLWEINLADLESYYDVSLTELRNKSPWAIYNQIPIIVETDEGLLRQREEIKKQIEELRLRFWED